MPLDSSQSFQIILAIVITSATAIIGSIAYLMRVKMSKGEFRDSRSIDSKTLSDVLRRLEKDIAEVKVDVKEIRRYLWNMHLPTKNSPEGTSIGIGPEG